MKVNQRLYKSVNPTLFKLQVCLGPRTPSKLASRTSDFFFFFWTKLWQNPSRSEVRLNPNFFPLVSSRLVKVTPFLCDEALRSDRLRFSLGASSQWLWCAALVDYCGRGPSDNALAKPLAVSANDSYRCGGTALLNHSNLKVFECAALAVRSFICPCRSTQMFVQVGC